jgi:transcriptional regulator with PAS, ATPase and Fis domain
MPKKIILFSKDPAMVFFIRSITSENAVVHVLMHIPAFFKCVSSEKPDYVLIDILFETPEQFTESEYFWSYFDIPVYYIGTASYSDSFFTDRYRARILRIPDDACVIKKLLSPSPAERAAKAEQLKVLGLLAGNSPEMQLVKKDLTLVAGKNIPVLLLGESGTGKSLAAEIIHRLSERKKNIFYAVNMSSIPLSLAESELFGNVKGAFTGAENRGGYFHSAEKGTLFLDEIGDLDLQVQTKLLRIVETGLYHRVGADTESRTDVRLVFATNADLRKKIKKKLFREDLFYRISRYTIRLPPLRERASDLPQLCEHFLRQYDRHLSPAAMTRIASYSWPGNIRQLYNSLEHAVLVSSGRIIDADDIHID